MRKQVFVAIGVVAILVASAAQVSAVTMQLPIHSVTPGATNPSVTQANIGSTICVVGYTKTIRPPASYTTGLKRAQLRGSYAFYGSTNTKLFEEDHLIPLEVGGAPRSAANLWPEPWASARMKDQLENKMHLLVCAHQITLAAAQKVFVSNWVTAFNKYV